MEVTFEAKSMSNIDSTKGWSFAETLLAIGIERIAEKRKLEVKTGFFLLTFTETTTRHPIPKRRVTMQANDQGREHCRNMEE